MTAQENTPAARDAQDPIEREAAAKWWVAQNDVPSMTGPESVEFVKAYRFGGMAGLVYEFRDYLTARLP